MLYSNIYIYIYMHDQHSDPISYLISYRVCIESDHLKIKDELKLSLLEHHNRRENATLESHDIDSWVDTRSIHKLTGQPTQNGFPSRLVQKWEFGEDKISRLAHSKFKTESRSKSNFLIITKGLASNKSQTMIRLRQQIFEIQEI